MFDEIPYTQPAEMAMMPENPATIQKLKQGVRDAAAKYGVDARLNHVNTAPGHALVPDASGNPQVVEHAPAPQATEQAIAAKQPANTASEVPYIINPDHTVDNGMRPAEPVQTDVPEQSHPEVELGLLPEEEAAQPEKTAETLAEVRAKLTKIIAEMQELQAKLSQ